MNYRRQLVYSVLTLIVTVFTVSVLTSISRLSSLQTQLTVTPPAEGLWAVSQAEIELFRLLETLKAHPSTQSGLEPNEIAKRFDIFWSRVVILEGGEVGKWASSFKQ
ncbi:MAG: hypothetical protein V2J55_11405, partial [Candidatus Competibacteraceae bacterium]|nr:hypothetical protein [Candidatus Competibacteraceae bacterium]